MKAYLQKNGIRVGIILAAAALIIGLGSAARDGRIGVIQNVSGILKAPIQKVLSSAVNWFDTMYGYIYEYDSLRAENESLRSQLADAQKSARDGIEVEHAFLVPFSQNPMASSLAVVTALLPPLISSVLASKTVFA